jgi:integrase
MASFTERNGRHRALVRRGGFTKCATFGTYAAAKAWAEKIEREIDEIRATGVVRARGMTVGELIDRYVRELEPVKRWGRSKRADLARLRADLGHIKTDALTSAHITTYFAKRRREGSGGVVVSAQVGYLIGVLRTARGLWSLDVPLQAAEQARQALVGASMVSKSGRRDRRVSDAEIKRLVDYFLERPSKLPMADLVEFCMASAMRIGEVCRLRWDDLDEAKRTIVIRDRKHPQDKWGNDQVVPLLSATGYDALGIIKRQRRRSERIFPFLDKTVSSYFTRAVERLGIVDLHLHDVRHEAITRLFAAGYRIEQVALVSGHRDWAMLRRYTHVRAEDLHRPPEPAAKPKRARRTKAAPRQAEAV